MTPPSINDLRTTIAGLFHLLVLTLGLLPYSIGAANPSEISPRELQDWLSYHYLDPRTEKVTGYLNALEQRGVLADPVSRAPISAFLGLALRDPDSPIAGWASATERQASSAQTLAYALWIGDRSELAGELVKRHSLDEKIQQSLAVPAPDLRRLRLFSPAQIDVIWAAFAATGDLFYVKRLVKLLEKAYWQNKSDTELATAVRETLTKNMRLHARVRQQVWNMKHQADDEMTEILDTLWQQSLASFQPLPHRRNNFSALLGVHKNPLFERLWERLPDDELPRLETELTVKHDDHAWIEVFVSGMQMDHEQFVDVELSLQILDPNDKPVLRIARMSWLKGTLPTPFRVYRLPVGVEFLPNKERIPGRYRILATINDREGEATLELESSIEVLEKNELIF